MKSTANLTFRLSDQILLNNNANPCQDQLPMLVQIKHFWIVNLCIQI